MEEYNYEIEQKRKRNYCCWYPISNVLILDSLLQQTFTTNSISSEQASFQTNSQTLLENPPISDDVLYSIPNKIETLIE